GSSSSSYQYDVTFHHNYYYKCGSRLPFTRNSNFHIYNCYYYASTGTNMQVQSTAYAFIEGCYFENTNKTFTTSDGGVIKLYNNSVNSTSSVDASSTVVYVDARAQAVTNTCTNKSTTSGDSAAGTSYANFDTDSTLFYYDTENNVSDVSLMLTAENTKIYIPQYAGAGKLVQLDYSLHHTETNDAPAEDTSYKATYTETVPTTAGVYGRVTTTVDSEVAESDYTNSNYVQCYDDGSFYIYDAGSTSTTYAYYMFDNTYTSGTVTYTVTLRTGDNVGSKWNLVQFMTASGNIAVRSGGTVADYNGMFCYQANGGTETQISSTKWAKSTTYTIILTVNYDTNTVTLSINGETATLTGYTPEAITGIQFMTAKKAADRSFTVTSVVCKVD
ncbi:MAG: hypothetical protein K6A63_00070, partial [Acholeplasmatales bacterium]|nr:hypothetical protein [Acholeplasmatales bacterium]